MKLLGITWRGESMEDVELLRDLPPELVRVLSYCNGFILHEGALHVRGACSNPEWHSLRAAWHGPSAFHRLYDTVEHRDIPFAEDQVGDQFLIRDGGVLRLSAETGDIDAIADSLVDFFTRLSDDIEGFLNVCMSYRMQPGELLLAYPPFVCLESEVGASMKAGPASNVIHFHADLARQIRDIPDGGKIEFKMTE